MKDFFDSVWRYLFGADPRTLFGAGDWTFSFIADYSNYVKLALGVVFAFMVWLTIRSYRREGQSSRRVKMGLASMRIAVLVLLFLIVMKPAVVWHYSRTLYSDVMVIFDDSLSMALPTDVYEQDEAERIAGLLEVDASNVDNMTRLEIVRRALAGEDSLLTHLAQDHPMTFLAFSTDDPQRRPYVRKLGSIRLVGDRDPAGGGDPDAPTSVGGLIIADGQIDVGSRLDRQREMLDDPEIRRMLQDADSPLRRRAIEDLERQIQLMDESDDQGAQKNVEQMRSIVSMLRDAEVDIDRLVEAYETLIEQSPRRMPIPELSDEQRAIVVAQLRAQMLALDAGESEAGRRTQELIDQLEAGEISYKQFLLRLAEHEALVRDQRSAAERVDDVLAQLQGRGFQTRYAQAMGRALEMIRGRRTEGIIIIGDGQNTQEPRAPSIEDIKAEANRLGVPVYPVLVGSSRRPASVYVSSLRANDRVLRGSEMSFTAAVSYVNLESDSQVHLRLMRRAQGQSDAQWEEVGRTPEPVNLPRPSVDEYNQTLQVTDIAIPYEPEDVGQYEFKAVCDRDLGDPKARQVAETTVLVRVVDERIRVLLVSGDAGWEFQHIKNFLLRQPDLYRLSVWQQNADKDVNQAASTGMKLEHLPRTLEELIGSPGWTPEKTKGPDGKELFPGYNVVILYDPYPTEGGFDGRFVELVEQFVSVHGGGLCYIASNKHSQKLYERADFRPMRDVLPVVLAADVSSDVRLISGERSKPWRVRPTPYGEDHPIMLLEDAPETSLGVWSVLPGIYLSHPVYERKESARVLAVHSNPTRRGEADELPEPLIAYQRYGLGRVLYMGTDETWRWVFVDGGYYHRRYWSNAVRFLATLRPKLVDILLVEGREKYDLGQTVTIEARAYNDKYQPITEETFEVTLVSAEDPRETIKLTLEATDVENYPGKYRGTFEPEREGKYTVTALSGDQRAEKVAEKRLIITVPEAEKKQPQADAKLMHRLATGQRHLSIWDIDELKETIPAGKLEVPSDISKELWDTPLMLIAIVVLLCGEWILRKKYNMA